MKFLVDKTNKIDLHIHTHESDGSESVYRILNKARDEGLEVIAITDHNCDLARFKLYEKYDLEIISGCEIDVKINDKKIDLLAYEYNDMFAKKVLPRIEVQRLRKGRIDLKKVCKLIHLFGGKAILAHPFKYNYNGKELVEEVLKENCVDGIECIHSYHTQEEIDYLLDICKKNNLYVTAGSDYHAQEVVVRGIEEQKKLGRLVACNSTIEEQLIRAKKLYINKKR